MNQNSLLIPTSKYYHLDKHYIDRPVTFGHFRLFQIGRLYCTESTVIEKHAHINWFELTIVTDGKGTVYTNDIGTDVRRGDIYLSFPCDFHAITPHADEPLKYDFFAFGTDDAAFSADLEHIMQTNASSDSRIIRDERIASLVGEAIAELEENEPYASAFLTAVFTQILIRVIRGFLYRTTPPRMNITEPQSLCYRLMNYIDTHIYTMTGLEELAQATSYNYSYLSALFKKTTSGTLADYYRNRRLETARLLLLEENRTGSQIAELLNYSSIYTFSRAFKDHYGLSPEQYKKAMRSAEHAKKFKEKAHARDAQT